MKWTEWAQGHWILVNSDGEVVDEIKRSDAGFYILLSRTNSKYVSLEAAKKARDVGPQK